jgi:catechol 2,3-dioxygenase-like lactoylglutathione lyase family enzyme
MIIEHIALNVANATEMAQWYEQHLGMKIVRKGDHSQMHFIADDAGTTLLELYTNADAPIPDYATTDPLVLHIAFAVDDMDGERERLLAAGATSAGDVATTPAGDQLAMLRDPWGVCVQLVKRSQSML